MSLPVRCTVRMDLYPVNPRCLWISKKHNFRKRLVELREQCQNVAVRYNCLASVSGTGPERQLGVNLTFSDLKDFRWSILDELSKSLGARTIINPIMYGGDANWVKRHNGLA